MSGNMSGNKEQKMKSKALPLLALLIAFIGIASGAAVAQPRHEVSVVAFVPFEFVVGNRAFPSGTYVFEMATGSPKASDQAGVLVVRNRERRLYAAVATGVAADGSNAAPKLAFKRDGERVYLSNVWCQGGATGLTVHVPQGATEIAESDVLTVDATLTGGI
jgi:hypothetical protein